MCSTLCGLSTIRMSDGKESVITSTSALIHYHSGALCKALAVCTHLPYIQIFKVRFILPYRLCCLDSNVPPSAGCHCLRTR